MAAPESPPQHELLLPKTVSSYVGLSFAVFLGLIPRSIIKLQSQNRALTLKLSEAEEQLKQMKSRRKEDSKANARVVEIFASHRNGWQLEEKKLVHQIESCNEEMGKLRGRVEELEKCVDRLEREVEEREEMINFMSRQVNNEYDDDDDDDDVEEGDEKVEVKKEEFYGEEESGGLEYMSRFGVDRVLGEECFLQEGEEQQFLYGMGNGFSSDFVSSASKVWAERAGDWQDERCDSVVSSYQAKHFVARRESPWKLDGESTGVPSKLKLLEQELLNLEKIDKGELSKIPSLLRKQAKRYQALAIKIDDLCGKMRVNDPSDPTLNSECRTRRQTEFLIEAYRLQQRAIETGQKLMKLQTETAKSNFSNELGSHGKLTTRRSMDSIRNNLKEIQRNLEVWLARIMGDLEGILAMDGASRVREYYMSRYPFVR
ncbi:hypothetical protein IFM89_016599 [Coptis chinensis]|uniref:Uncharacterized protein n=1 Tax=Coptis chinensis TaxID=261450 RepID=A0A835MCV0_9MAGN|nr:hypothetical protein IFM89_016599 [Coptis chinensis]